MSTVSDAVKGSIGARSSSARSIAWGSVGAGSVDSGSETKQSSEPRIERSLPLPLQTAAPMFSPVTSPQLSAASLPGPHLGAAPSVDTSNLNQTLLALQLLRQTIFQQHALQQLPRAVATAMPARPPLSSLPGASVATPCDQCVQYQLALKYQTALLNQKDSEIARLKDILQKSQQDSEMSSLKERLANLTEAFNKKSSELDSTNASFHSYREGYRKLLGTLHGKLKPLVNIIENGIDPSGKVESLEGSQDGSHSHSQSQSHSGTNALISPLPSPSAPAIGQLPPLTDYRNGFADSMDASGLSLSGSALGTSAQGDGDQSNGIFDDRSAPSSPQKRPADPKAPLVAPASKKHRKR